MKRVIPFALVLMCSVAIAGAPVTDLMADPLFMAKVASPKLRKLLVIAVLMPLWASYLVKAYAWRGMLSETGPVAWLTQPFGLDTPGYGLAAVVLTLAYL